MKRFAFLVHALSPTHRALLGVRTARAGLALGWRDGTADTDVAVLCHLQLGDLVEGVVVGIPMTPELILGDQNRALERMVTAVDRAGPVDAVGLGSLCAVVASRGVELAQRVDLPVTTGAAATAWALVSNVRQVVEHHDGPIGVLGSSGAVGGAVVGILAQEGLDIRVDHRR
ncbi:MAG: hypothetical protein QGG40_06270, partial [Myxococcota bacterium]|nr:hypothetical protein [Myxococcota bacterium]